MNRSMRWLGAMSIVVFVAIFGARAAPAGEAVYTDVDAATLSALIGRGVKVVDVRTPDEWRGTGVIAGSKLITAFDARGQFNADFPAAFAATVGHGEDVVLICHSGGRSTVISRLLAERGGYTRVYNAEGGIADWIATGHPVERCTRC